MSTRSGKRIHLSFHENTMKSEADFTRSERKTRSKHAKENFDELHVSRKLKKQNYVAYPADDEGVDTVDSKHEEKTTRILRKTALKECNTTSSTESVEPAANSSRKSVRPTRRTRKFDENSQDTPVVAPQDEDVNKVELPKSKKGKKKKKVEQEQVVEIKVAESKKKSKKKKGRRSSSMVVENIGQEAPSSLNKSNMSVDSFHSAAESPRNCNEFVPLLHKDLAITSTTFENHDTNKTEARKMRSSIKFDNILTNENVTEMVPRRRKSSVKVSLDNQAKGAVFDKDKSNQENMIRHDIAASQDTKGDKNSLLDLELNSKRKSLRNAAVDKIATPTKINTTLEKDETKVISLPKLKNTSIADEDIKEAIDMFENTSLEIDSVTEPIPKDKKRKSAIFEVINVIEKSSPLKSIGKDNKRKSVTKETIKDNINNVENGSLIDATFNSIENSSLFKASQMKLFTEKSQIKHDVDTTFDKDSETEESQGGKKSIDNVTFDLTSSPFKSANDLSSPFKMTDDNGSKRKSIINTTYEKDNTTNHEDMKETATDLLFPTFDNNTTETNINTTFESDLNENKKTPELKNNRKSLPGLSSQKVTDTEVNSTFNVDQGNKLDTTFDKNSKSSLISSDSSMITMDKSDASRISITSDESKNEENILNTTPVLIESSLDDSQMNITKTPLKQTTPLKMEPVPVTPLKREGTFTKDEPEVMHSPRSSLSRTPAKQASLPSPGFTPFHVNKSSSKEKSVMNLTRSIEKSRSSLAEPRTTKVMFCSPVNNQAVVIQNRRKVIKSNLKGSNKSFVFDDSVSLESRPVRRKRSYTQSDAEEARVKRTRLADGLQQSVDRLSRPRTSSASAKLAEPTTPSKKPTTPSKKSDAKVSRTKLPNFAALHQKQFAKMESLDECQERKAKRAKQLLTPTGATSMLERISPKDKAEAEKPKEAPEKSKEAPKKPETPIKSLPTFKSLNPGYTRFGFKLNLDVNPFSIPSKAQPKPKENKPNGLKREPTLPSLAGATSVRREVLKQTVMREKSFTDRRNVKRTENRTVIKGVRTNRRFELQMRMRDI